MKTVNLKTKCNEELLRLYETAAREHGEALDKSNPETANRAHDLVTAIRHELKERGSEMILVPLLRSPEGRVRSWAATHLLEIAPDEAVPVLEDLANGERGYLRLGSEMVLKEWRAGRLRLP